MLDNTLQVFAQRRVRSAGKGGRRDAVVANDELAILSSNAWCQEDNFTAPEQVISFQILTCKY